MPRPDARHRALSGDQQLSEAIRDLQEQLDALPALALRVVAGRYAEPHVVSLDKKPAAIMCVRVTDIDDPETPIAHGAAVEWVWTSRGAEVRYVDGLVDGYDYAITYMVIGG